MVVIATPSTAPSAPCCNTNEPGPTPAVPVSAVNQNTVSAPVSTVNGQPASTRMRAISINQGQCATIKWQMHDTAGRPVDLTSVDLVNGPAENETYAIVLRLKEQLSLGVHNAPTQVTGTITDAATGQVEFNLTSAMVGLPGVYYGEVALVTKDADPCTATCAVFSNIFSLIISRSTLGTETQNGPPSIAEIRLHLRDSSPGESFLLDNLMFDDAEIALAIQRPVQYWNEMPPPIATFNTQTFPFRYHWLEGICANLFFMVAEQYRRNQLDYAAAGLQISDQNKEQNYERGGQMRWQAYREWVRAKKAQINLESCYGEVGSLYQYGVYSSGIRSRY